MTAIGYTSRMHPSRTFYARTCVTLHGNPGEALCALPAGGYSHHGNYNGNRADRGDLGLIAATTLRCDQVVQLAVHGIGPGREILDELIGQQAGQVSLGVHDKAR